MQWKLWRRRSSSSLARRSLVLSSAAAAACAAPYAVGCASGTDAIWLALAAANVGPGDAVITTPFSFFASVSAILRCGAQPLLADIDPATFNLSADATEEVLRSQTGAQRSRRFCRCISTASARTGTRSAALKEKYGVLLIEDAAQAFGATLEWNACGRSGRCCGLQLLPDEESERDGRCGAGDDGLGGDRRPCARAAGSWHAATLLSR